MLIASVRRSSPEITLPPSEPMPGTLATMTPLQVRIAPLLTAAPPCLPLCHRSVLGRIWESKNFSHTDVDSAGRACDPRRGRGRARSRPLCAFAVLCVSGVR